MLFKEMLLWKKYIIENYITSNDIWHVLLDNQALVKVIQITKRNVEKLSQEAKEKLVLRDIAHD